MAGTSGVAERADRLGGLVRIGGEQVVEAFVAKRVQEPFSALLVSVFLLANKRGEGGKRRRKKRGGRKVPTCMALAGRSTH